MANLQFNVPWRYDGKKVTRIGKDGRERQIEADIVVLATELRSRQEEAIKYEGLAPKVIRIGDFVQPTKIHYAFREGWIAVFQF